MVVNFAFVNRRSLFTLDQQISFAQILADRINSFTPHYWDHYLTSPYHITEFINNTGNKNKGNDYKGSVEITFIQILITCNIWNMREWYGSRIPRLMLGIKALSC